MMGDLIGSAEQSINDAREIMEEILRKGLIEIQSTRVVCHYCEHSVGLRDDGRPFPHLKNCVVTRAEQWLDELSPVFH